MEDNYFKNHGGNIIKIYLDTSVISALFDNRATERQELTKEFFDKFEKHEIYISTLVVEEIGAANEIQRQKMQKIIQGFKILELNDEIEILAWEYIKREVFSDRYAADALHVAVGAVNEIDYLISWNFKHLVKVGTRKSVNQINNELGYGQIEIIAPPEL